VFSNVGLMLLVGTIGSGSANDILKHFLILNHLCIHGTPLLQNYLWGKGRRKTTRPTLLFQKH
jgi:hypothetical protein